MSYSSEVLADSPWGFWRLTESSLSGAAADAGSNATAFAYVAVATGKTALLSDGGTAVSGSGSDAIARLASVPASLNGSNATAECWVKIPASNVQGPFVNLGTYGTNGWAVGVGDTTMDNAGHQLILLNESIAWVQTGFTLTAGTHHVMVTRSAANLFTCYVDGSSVYSTTFTPNTPTGAVTVGGATSAARSLSSTVDIDNVALYASALSSTRVTAHYASGSGDNTAVSADSPVIWLKLDDTNQVADSSSNARPLSISGTAITANQAGPTSGKAVAFSTATGSAQTLVAVTQPTTATYEAWVYLTANPAVKTTVLAFGGAGGSGLSAGMSIDTAGKVTLDLWSGSNVSITAPSALSLNAWHHVVCSVGAAGAKVRVDKTTVVSSGTTAVFSAVTGALYLRNGGPSTPGGTGAMTIAEPAAWYNVQLSDTRTDAHYDAMFAGPSGSFAASLPRPTIALTGTYRDVGTLAATFPKLTAALTGTYIALESGSLAAAIPVPTVALSGTYTPPTTPSGSFDASFPVPIVALAGDYHPHESGSFALTLPVPAVALSGTYTDPPHPVGTFSLTFPVPVVALAGLYIGPVPTDTSNALDGLDLLLTAAVFITRPVAAVPPSLVAAERYDKSIAYPVPTMVNGRPT